MKTSLKPINQREQLIAKVAAQRRCLSTHIMALHTPMALVDKGMAALHHIKQHPVLAMGSGLLLFKIIRVSPVARWFNAGKLAWQFVRKLKS